MSTADPDAIPFDRLIDAEGEPQVCPFCGEPVEDGEGYRVELAHGRHWLVHDLCADKALARVEDEPEDEEDGL